MLSDVKHLWPWAALLLLGAYHGINPAMGWLFAVALGLQEKARRAVLQALLPIGLGHAMSIGAIVAVLSIARASVSHSLLRIAAAAVLVSFGVYRLVRSRHPRWVGMRVGFQDLTLWSFLMASAHGAGLMLAPIILGWPGGHHAHQDAFHLSRLAVDAPLLSAQALTFDGVGSWLAPVGVHTLGYLLVTGATALIVYEKLGLALLRRAWLNLDHLWALALIATGVLTLFV